jgi:hypothetical protein
VFQVRFQEKPLQPFLQTHKGAIFNRLKIIVICVSRPKSASFSSESERGQKALFGRGARTIKKNYKFILYLPTVFK